MFEKCKRINNFRINDEMKFLALIKMDGIDWKGWKVGHISYHFTCNGTLVPKRDLNDPWPGEGLDIIVLYSIQYLKFNKINILSEFEILLYDSLNVSWFSIWLAQDETARIWLVIPVIGWTVKVVFFPA